MERPCFTVLSAEASFAPPQSLFFQVLLVALDHLLLLDQLLQSAL
jgi:hypothetical protein